MEGIILHFDSAGRAGIIRDDGGNRYRFVEHDWKAEGAPVAGTRVDFVADQGSATQIYAAIPSSVVPKSAVVPPPAAPAMVPTGNVGDFGNRLQNLFVNGMHNRFGMLASAIAGISLFMPVLALPFGLGTVNLIDLGSGKFVLILLVVVAILFYGGATRLFTQVAVGVVFAILLYQYQEIYSKLSQANSMVGMFGRTAETPNFFGLLRLGALINLAACVALGMAAFSRPYKHNPKAI